MNPIQFAHTYSEPLVQLAAAFNASKDASKAAAEANGERSKSLTQQIKDFATLTYIDGVPTADARAGLTYALTAFEVAKGSVKASGNHFAGYRAMLADDIDIDAKSNKDAQAYIESADVKAKNEARKAFAKHTQKWTATQWLALLAREGISTSKVTAPVTTTTADDAEDGENQGTGDIVTTGEAGEIEREAEAA